MLREHRISDRRVTISTNRYARTIRTLKLVSHITTTKPMRRFSDRLVSSSSTAADQSKAFADINAYSDETESVSSSSSDHDYKALVEMIGLHQTVKVLEAEFSLVTGGTGKRNNMDESKSGYTRFRIVV